MKSRALTLASIVFLSMSGTVYAQSRQSALYDAIAVMNAEHGINVIMMPDAANTYAVIDPVRGVSIGTESDSQALPPGYTNVDSSKSIIIRILARNAGLPLNADSAEVSKAYSKNPFLKTLLGVEYKSNIGVQAGKLPNTMGGFSTSSRSGLAEVNLVNNLANGAADFLIKRATEELSVAVIQKLQNFLSRYPEFEILFPKTVKLLQPISPYDYAKTLNALKAALQGDLDAMPSRIPTLYSVQRYRVINQKAPILTLAFAASTIYTELKGSVGISVTLHDLDTCDYLTAQNNYASFFHILSLVSDNLRKKLISDPEDNEYPYFSIGEINKVTNSDPLNKEQLMRIFLGLLYQRSDSISIWTTSGRHTCGELLSSWASNNRINLSTLLDAMGNAGSNLSRIDAVLQSIKSNDMITSQATGKSTFSVERFKECNDLIVASIEILKPFVSGTDSASTLKEEFRSICEYWPTFSADGLDMVQAISQKNYSLGIENLSGMLKAAVSYIKSKDSDITFTESLHKDMDSALNNDIKKAEINLSDLNRKLAALSTVKPMSATGQSDQYVREQMLTTQITQLTQQLSALKWQKKDPEKIMDGLNKVLQYCQLFAALSTAENSQEVTSLLETYALPSGSSRVKKETIFNAAVNAYVGGFFSRSHAVGAGFTNRYGFTAPIGFTVSHGLDRAGSFSLLVGLFDIGGIIQYKLNNEGNYEQDINLAGLISPSTQIVYGFPFFIPLSIGAGYQWTSPSTVNANNIHLIGHFNAFLAVDIPLFNLAAIRKR